VSGLNEDDGILLLSDYEIAIEYVESDKEKSQRSLSRFALQGLRR
jgi:hypothetical protein